MPKGMFTQGVCVLLDRPTSLDDMESALAGFEICRRIDEFETWSFGGPTLIVARDVESNALVAVDTVDQPWPDHMGDPQNESMIFGAWSMGHFGPFAWPGGLERAAAQCWTWDGGRTIAEDHAAFVRIRASYAFGAADDHPIMPANYDPFPELEFVTRLVSALLDLPGAICYFNPNGEVLKDKAGLQDSLAFGEEHNLPPLEVWSNIRLFNVDAEWSMMDTVGNSQLDFPDTEACFHAESYDFNAVDNFLRNVSLYLLNNGEVIRDGDTMDGPGRIRWQSQQFENGICDPPRRVLRWLPLDDHPVPAEIEGAGDGA